MTIVEALERGTALLRQAGIESPSLDASLLLSDILHTSRPLLLAHRDDLLSAIDAKLYFEHIEQRIGGFAVAYILGFKEFRNLDFKVSPSVLIPRPDTETLVEAALESLQLQAKNGNSAHILDLCTGSGCVAIALKNERPDLIIWASDLSPEALSIAKDNAANLLGVQERLQGIEPIHFIKSNLFESITGTFNLIVSNPPYIPTAHIATLAAEVQNEPKMALDGGADGLILIRTIIKESILHLDLGGMLLIESGSEQTSEIATLLGAEGFHSVRIFKDLSGRDRVTSGIIGEGTIEI